MIKNQIKPTDDSIHNIALITPEESAERERRYNIPRIVFMHLSYSFFLKKREKSPRGTLMGTRILLDVHKQIGSPTFNRSQNQVQE